MSLRVWCASQVSTDLEPSSSATSSAFANTRSVNACNREVSLVSAPSAAALSAVLVYAGSTSATSSRAAPITPAHASTGCSGTSCWTDMPSR